MNGKVKYFYLKTSNNITGPFVGTKIMAMYQAKKISNDALVSHDKIAWHKLSELLQIPSSPKLEIVDKNPTTKAEQIRVKTQNIIIEEPVLRQNVEYEFDYDCDDNEYDCITNGRIIGNTLQLIWNTPDKLPELYDALRAGKIMTIFLTVLSFWGILLLLTAGCISVVVGSFANNLLWGLLWCVVVNAGVFFEFFLLRVIVGSEYGRINEDTLLSLMSSINLAVLSTFSALCMAIYLNIIHSGMVHMSRELIVGVIAIFVFSFFFANMAAGLRLGVVEFYGFRPRGAVWLSALFIAQCVIFIALSALLVIII